MPSASALFGGLAAALLVIVFLYGASLSCRDASRALQEVGTPFESGTAVGMHFHNSERSGGLQPGLDQGFDSIEVDVFVIDNAVLVGHNLGDLHSHNSLQALYLGPLLDLVRRNDGTVYPQPYGRTSLTLMIDVKVTPQQTAEQSFDIIHSILTQYAEEEPGLLASWHGHDNAISAPGAVTVMISGERPAASHLLSQRGPRYAILDGREQDLNADLPLSLVPMISKAWRSEAGAALHGLDPLQLSVAETAATQQLLQQAHAQGRGVRFWGTLDTPRQWQDLLDLGIDLISTDDVAGLRAFVAARLVRQQRRRRRPLARWSLQQPALPRAFSLDIAVREMFGRRAAVWPAPNSP